MRAAGRFLLGASVLAGIAVSITSAALAQHSVRDVVYSNTADVQVGGGVEPSGATVGRLAAVDVYVNDRGPATAKNVVLTAKLPALSTFVSVSQSTGTCAVSAGTLTCPLGAIPRYLEADLQIVLRMPSVPGPQVTTVRVKSSTPDLVKTNNSRSFTVNALASSKDSTASFIPLPGGTVSTGHRTSSRNPTSTTVRAHIQYPAPLTVAEHSTTDTAEACGTGYTCFGQYVTASFVDGNILKPSVMTVTFDSSEVKGHRLLGVRVFDYGSLVPKCSGTSDGAAKPDPCVASRLALPNGSWQLVIRFNYGVNIRLGGA
jgi:hypothetical protein